MQSELQKNSVTPQDKTILLSRYANQFTTLKHIDRIAEANKNISLFDRWIDRYKLDQIQEPERIIFLLAFNLATFQPDEPNTQAIREPWRVAKDGVANCVDYTTFVSSFLRNPRLRISHKIRMVSFDNSKNYSHIYTLTANAILDPVIAQDQNGNERIKNKFSRVGFYNIETPYQNKFDFNVK